MTAILMLIHHGETAYILGDALHPPIHPDPRLRELHQGNRQSMLYRDIEVQYQDALRQFRQNPLSCSPPGGETLERITRRILAALAAIAVVTHKLPIAIVRCLILGDGPTHVWDALPAPA